MTCKISDFYHYSSNQYCNFCENLHHFWQKSKLRRNFLKLWYILFTISFNVQTPKSYSMGILLHHLIFFIKLRKFIFGLAFSKHHNIPSNIKNEKEGTSIVWFACGSSCPLIIWFIGFERMTPEKTVMLFISLKTKMWPNHWTHPLILLIT